MLMEEIHKILDRAKKDGWVMEPEAKLLLSNAGIEVPRFRWTQVLEEAEDFASEIGYPVVAKVVSPSLIHKSDSGGVVVGIRDEEELKKAFNRFNSLDGYAGTLVEETLQGLELIVGAKIDYQFGPIVLLGIGGIGVEIYKDTILRMAPVDKENVYSMITNLRAHEILEGYRGSSGINLDELCSLITVFSDFVMKIEDRIEAIDLNPVICTSDRCIVADARIMLRNEG
jgi:succinyl-CoA synthetase beta subunit